MENMGFKAYDAEHKMKSLSSIVGDLQTSTANMTDEQKQNTIAQIFGEEAMSGVLTLMKNGPQALDDLTQSYINSDGAAKAMAKTMQDNAKSSIEQMMGSLETAAIKIEGAFAPSITKLANYVQDLANKFSALSPEQQMFYTKLALGAAALGPAIKLVGGLTSTIGGVIKIGSKIASVFGAGTVATTTLATATTAAGGATEAAAVGGFAKLASGLKSTGLIARLLPALFTPVGLAVAAVGLTAGLTAYALSQEVVPKVDLFADGVESNMARVTDSLGNTSDAIKQTPVVISDATKKNVGAYMEMDNKVQKSLLNMKFTNATITSDMAKDLTTTFSAMGQTINTELDKDLADSSAKLEKLFKGSNLSGTDQTDILAQIQTHYATQKTETQKATEEINGIFKTSAETGVAITTDQRARISELNSQMTTTAVTALSDTEKESAVILGRIRDQSKRITTETASDIVKQLEDQRVKAVDAANVEYAERIRIAENIRSEGGAKSGELADKVIKDAEAQRDKVIDAANTTKTQGIDVLKESYTGLGTEVNAQTGQILDGWAKMAAWWGNNSFPTKTATIDTTQNISASGNGSNIYGTNSYSPKEPVKQYNFIDGTQNQSTGGGGTHVPTYHPETDSWYAKGTDNAKRGIATVGEQGYELVVGRQQRLFSGGEQVLNHNRTKSLLQGNNSPTQSNQGQYQLAQPQQVQVAGGSGNNIKVDVQVNSNSDVDGIVQEAVQQVGYKLKEALTNIKK